MKKIFTGVLCLSFCLVVAFVFSNVASATKMVDDANCLVCHTVGDVGVTEGLHGKHSVCGDCHSGTPEAGNVAASSCVVCHEEKCDSVNAHDPGLGATCLTCHADCKESETTTTIDDSGSSTCPSVVIYGEDSDEVALLRAYRDEVLSKTSEGQKLTSLYYKMSPVMVVAIENSKILKLSIKKRIDALLPVIEAQLLAQ